jgi:hypothetical protein
MLGTLSSSRRNPTNRRLESSSTVNDGEEIYLGSFESGEFARDVITLEE